MTQSESVPSVRLLFIPGMKPKPPADLHQQQLFRCLVQGLARLDANCAQQVAAHPTLFELLSWTYAFYGRYRDIGLDLPGIERALQLHEPPPEDIRDIDSLNRRVKRLVHIVGDAFPLLTPLLAKPYVRLTMHEARRYLRNRRGIASDIRRNVADSLCAAWERDERVLLIGHSLGSVIAYDTLWELSRQNVSGTVSLFLTMGSPLATRFIRSHLQGANHSGADRFPTNIRRWENFSARGEMTAIHRELYPTFGAMVEEGVLESLIDHTEFYNYFRGDIGLNVHKSYGYLLTTPVARAILSWLLYD